MTINLLIYKNLPVLSQLQLEEALFLHNNENWCILNYNTTPAIVLGSSNKPNDLINLKKVKANKIPIIKRFTGGGTVFVDQDTIFFSMILSKDLTKLHFPEQILRWLEEFFISALKIKNFQLLENDFIINNNKCCGNAQYIKKDKFLHHCSFLWDFSKKNMNDYLLLPKKIPQYRKKRSHDEFLCKLKDFIPSKLLFLDLIKQELEKKFIVIETGLSGEIKNLMKKADRTTIL
jgi:lipoate---protein ligase